MAGCSGPCPVKFLVSPKMENGEPPFSLGNLFLCSTTLVLGFWGFFLILEQNSHVPSSAFSVLSSHWAPQMSESVFFIPFH